ncbi:MAG: hypothetical protein AUI92_05375 [Thaumarchaeota archaeon 13_1_40CM_3_38_6]|nr:MAG: hypothetical protein AUI92_05375 [Thaumarchaeota archaeon 13_1_40CM_3_38_6]
MSKYPNYKFKEVVDYTLAHINHKEQRYETVGDWIVVPHKPVKIRVSKLPDERYVYLVQVHELIEYRLCAERGITDKEVVAFDVMFEDERARGLHGKRAEPGNDPRAPYRKEHQFATKVEKQLAEKLGVNWKEYSESVEAL